MWSSSDHLYDNSKQQKTVAIINQLGLGKFNGVNPHGVDKVPNVINELEQSHFNKVWDLAFSDREITNRAVLVDTIVILCENDLFDTEKLIRLIEAKDDIAQVADEILAEAGNSLYMPMR